MQVPLTVVLRIIFLHILIYASSSIVDLCRIAIPGGSTKENCCAALDGQLQAVNERRDSQGVGTCGNGLYWLRRLRARDCPARPRKSGTMRAAPRVWTSNFVFFGGNCTPGHFAPAQAVHAQQHPPHITLRQWWILSKLKSRRSSLDLELAR